jgi:hypothetical protein
MSYVVQWELEDQGHGGAAISDDPTAAIRAAANNFDPDLEDLASELRGIDRYLCRDGAWYGRINVAGGVLTIAVEPGPLVCAGKFDGVLRDVMGPILEPIGAAPESVPPPKTPDDVVGVAKPTSTSSTSLAAVMGSSESLGGPRRRHMTL